MSGCLDPSSRLPLVTQRHSQQMPVGAAIAFAQRLQCHSAPPPKPQRVKEKFSVPDLSGLSGTGSGTGTCLLPSMTSRRLQLRDIDRPIITDRMDGWTGSLAVSLVAGQYCMSRTVSVIGSFSHKPDWPGTLHVARCLSLVTRYSSLAASGAGPTQDPANQSVTHPVHTRVQGLQAQNTSRTRCSYMCFITWTIVVLMSNSNISPVARTTFSHPAWLSAARTLRWNLEGPATAQPEPTTQLARRYAGPEEAKDAKLLCPATVPSWAWVMWYAVRSK